MFKVEEMISNTVDGPTILHQESVIDLINAGVQIALDEEVGFQRSCCGGMYEKSSSTVEIPDIDINARFHLKSDWITVCTTNTSFLYEIKVNEGFKDKIDKMALLMQYHGNTNQTEVGQHDKSISKSYVDGPGGSKYLSSHLARWQLVGVIKEMQEFGLEVDQASRMAAEVGLRNGVYNVMIYDSSVCRRGVLKKWAFQNLLEKYIDKAPENSRKDLTKIMKTILVFFPQTGVQVDYTAGFHISEDAIPEETKVWVKSEQPWPSKKLKGEVLQEGALLVPKTFKDSTKTEKSKRWRINFDLNMIINDHDYSSNIDVRRVLITLKNIRNIILQCNLVKSYYLKLSIAWAMFENQNERKVMNNTNLLTLCLEYLANALETMKLPDFFNPKFNHFHRNKDRSYEGKRVAEKIKEIVNNLEETLGKIGTENQAFAEKIEKQIYDSRVTLFENGIDKENWISLIASNLPMLSKSDLGRVHDWINSFEFPVTYADVNKHRKKQHMKEKRKKICWQPFLKSAYMEIFHGKEILEYKTEVYEKLLQSNNDHLSRSIIDFYFNNSETLLSSRQKMKIWEELESLLKKHFDCDLAGFGSTFNGFGLQGCDLDLQIFTENIGANKLIFLEKVKAILRKNSVINDDAVVIKARVPILKAKHRRTGIPLDIGVVKSPGSSNDNVREAHLFYYCSRQDPRVVPLMLAVKKWAQSQNINNAHKHTFSSHALALMVIHYLMVETSPPILPNYFQTFPKIFNEKIRLENLRFDKLEICSIVQHHTCQKTLGQLFLGFLGYFADLDTDKFCITMTEKVDRMDSKVYASRESKTKFQPIIVQDPFNYRNVTFVVNTRSRLKKVMNKFNFSRQMANGKDSFEEICLLSDSNENEQIKTKNDNFDVTDLQVVIDSLD